MNGIEYGQKYAAYEAAMKRNNNFGMTDKEQIRAQYERQGKAIQDAQIKAENKTLGREIAREKAAQRRAAQQAGGDLSQALAGKTTTPTATTVPPTVQMPAERISLEGFNTKRNQRLQKKLYRQEQKALGAAGTAAETARPISNRFEINGTYWLQDENGRYKSFTSKKEYIREMKRLSKEGVKFDPNAGVPKDFNPANPNNLPGVKPGAATGAGTGAATGAGAGAATGAGAGAGAATGAGAGAATGAGAGAATGAGAGAASGAGAGAASGAATGAKKGFFSRIGQGIKNGFKKLGKGLKNIGTKIGNFFKGKGGKATLIGLGIAALIGGAAWLFNKCSGNKAEDAAPIKPTPTVPGKEEPETPVEPGKEDPETPIAPVPGKEEPEEPTKPGKEDPTKPVEPGKEEPEAPVNVVPKDYEVKPGDCVWNIAKQHLKDLSNDPNYKPTNAEILKHTKELMELNQLVFEPDGYHVMIYPKQHLKLAA